MSTQPTPPSGKPPGVFRVKSFEDAAEAKEKIDHLVATHAEFVVIVTVYKEKD